MKDFERIVEPIKTLIRLNPEQEQYKTFLATIKQHYQKTRLWKQDKT